MIIGLQELEDCDWGGEPLHLQQNIHKQVAEQREEIAVLIRSEPLVVQQSDDG